MFDADDFVIFVYFVLDPKTNEIKIGETKEPRERIAQLEQEAGHPLLVLAVVEDRLPLEKVLHIKFDHLMTRGERFSAEPELIAFINELHFDRHSNKKESKEIYTKECSVCGASFTKDNPLAARNALIGHTNRKHRG